MKRPRRLVGPHYLEAVWLWTDRIDGVQNGASKRKEVDRVIQPVELENKVALIVGGVSEKGRKLAVSFAERGMDVAVIFFDGRNEEAKSLQQRIEALGRRCLLLRGTGQESLDQESFARWAMAEIMETLGRLDVFINVSEKPFALAALNGGKSQAATTEAQALFPHFRIMRAALNEIVS